MVGGSKLVHDIYNGLCPCIFAVIIVHMGYCNGTLYLWGENPDRNDAPHPEHPLGASLKDMQKALWGTK